MSKEQEQKNKDIVTAYVDVVNKGELDALSKYAVEDYVEHDPAPGQGPGLEGLKHAYYMFNSPFPDLYFVFDDVIGEGDLVVGRGIITGTHEGEFFGIAPTQKKVHWTGTRLFRLKDDKVTEGWFNMDMLGLMTQMGVVPGPPPPEMGPRNNLTGAPSTREANHQLMKDFVEELWNKGNMAWADEHFHPEHTSPNAPQLPSGSEGTKMIVQMMRNAFPDFHMDITHIVAEDDRVAARFEETGTHNGDLMGIAPTGKSVKFSEIGILRVADGKIVETWYDVDMMGMMQQLGVGG